MEFTSYIEQQLIIIVPVLYAVGALIKKSRINDRLIPFILGVLGILLVSSYRLSIDLPTSVGEIFGVIFSSITQGLLCAAASVYVHNVVKQIKKGDDLDKDADNQDD